MRPADWTKNIFVFPALVFGQRLSGSTAEVLWAVGAAVACFVCFCLASSAIYIFNDVTDRHSDRLHPEKRHRPIAAGEVDVRSALVLAAICASCAVGGSFVLDRALGVIIVAYLVLMVLYSLGLKRAMILDCILISVGFCLRAIAGAVAVRVDISPWLIICTFALCLFVAFGKRRTEIAQLGVGGEQFRRALAGYTPELLAHMLDVTSGLAVVCFLLYAMDERTQRIVTDKLIYTTPMVLYCVFRFSALVQKGTYSGPVQLILHDLPFQAGLVLWGLVCAGLIYADELGLGLGGVFAW